MSEGPLSGVNVLDFSRGIAGAVCSLQVVDAGGAVTKVERLTGDPMRESGPDTDVASAVFRGLNRGKRSVCIDYTSDAARGALESLTRTADVVIEDFQPGEPSPVDYEMSRALKGNIVYCKITPYGESGRYAEYPATELELQGVTGHTWFLGEMGNPPVRVGADIAEVGAGKHAFAGIIAALLRRDMGGKGQKVSVTLAGSLMSLGSHWMADFSDPDEFTGGVSHPYEVAETGYKTSDGQVVFGLFGLKESRRQSWQELCRRVGLESLLEDPWIKEHGAGYVGVGKDAQQMKPILEGAMASWTRDDFVTMINEIGARAAPMLTYEDLYGEDLHPEVQANGVMMNVPADAVPGFRVIVSPWAGAGGFEPPDLSPAPLLGQHTAEALEEAGLSREDISQLQQSGVIKT